MDIYSGQVIDPVRLAYLVALAERQTQDAKQIELFRKYYDGDHPTSLTQRQREFLSIASGQSFCENYCTLVVDGLAERLAVIGFSTGDDAVDDTLWNWWQKNRMDSQAGLAHTYAGRDSASYIVVGWNNEEARPEFWVNEAFDGNEGVKVHWVGAPGAGGRILFASKRWREETDEGGKIETRRRMNLYLPGEICKYVSGDDASIGDAGWKPYMENDEPWPAPWVDADGQPLGVAVIPLLNKRTGKSELANVTPMQDAINKTEIDILAASDVEGFGIYTHTGGSEIENAKVFPGAFWQDTDPLASFGKIAGSELGGLLAVYEKHVKTLAVITRRPLRMFTGGVDAQSGESKKQDEAGLVAQAKDATIHFGNAWEDVMYLAAKLDRVYGQGSVPEGLVISCEWDDVETRNEEAHEAGVVLKFEKGIIDQAQAWKELGYTQGEQAAMLRRQQAKEAKAVSNAVKILAAQTQQPEQSEQEADDEPDQPTENEDEGDDNG